jgi:uncharacterized protein YuzE
MRIHYDKSQDALYLRFSENPYYESEEIKEGIILDYDKNGEIIGIEILDVSKNLPQKFLSSLKKEKLFLKVGV